jgi:hypothetical protein
MPGTSIMCNYKGGCTVNGDHHGVGASQVQSPRRPHQISETLVTKSAKTTGKNLDVKMNAKLVKI